MPVAIATTSSLLDTVRFAIELEGFTPRERDRAFAMEAGLVITPIHNKRIWTLTEDETIKPPPGHTKLEVKSPILTGEAGMADIEDRLLRIHRAGLQTNETCALHIHASGTGSEWDHLCKAQYDQYNSLHRAFLANAGTYYQNISPARRDNPYCKQLTGEYADPDAWIGLNYNF